MGKSKKNKPQGTMQDDFDDGVDECISEAADESFMESLVPKAIAFAKNIHEGQMRDDGTPYFGHVERVANAVKKQSDVHAYIIALLHDVMEDSDTTFEQLSEAFTEDIAKDVQVLTKVSGVDFETYMKRIVIKYVPFYVKLVDRLDNVKSLAKCGSVEKIERYTKETKEIFVPIAKSARYAKLPEFAVLIAEIEKYLE